MTSIADTFAAQLADLRRRSDETDRRMAESIQRMYGILEEMKVANDAILAELE
jgi:hypothetical protein